MNHKNLLIVSSLIGILLILVIGFMSILTFIDYSTDEFYDNSTIDTTEEYPSYEYPAYDDGLTYFNNSTPKSTAVSTAQLTKGVNGFYGYPDKVYLTPDGKYWMVHVVGSYVTVDAKTGMAKDENGEWKSLDELKASYIASLHRDVEEDVGKPQKITWNGKEIWKVPIYEYITTYNLQEGPTAYLKDEPIGHVYIDLKTGKSKFVYSNLIYRGFYDTLDIIMGTDGWLTLKQVDEFANYWPYPFRDALRDLYPE